MKNEVLLHNILQRLLYNHQLTSFRVIVEINFPCLS